MKLATALLNLVLVLLLSCEFYECLLCCIAVCLYHAYQILHSGEYTNETLMAIGMAVETALWFSVVYFIFHGWKKQGYESNNKRRKKKEKSFWERMKWSFAITFNVVYPLLILFIVINPVKRIEKYALHDSHKRIGIVYKKYSILEFRRRASRSHYLRIGISSSQTLEHRLNGDKLPIYESMHIGDTVILRVSDKYPRFNKVLKWHPTPEEVEKYKTPVKLIEKK